jgi:DNA-binding MarR family transcriptional regulator
MRPAKSDRADKVEEEAPARSEFLESRAGYLLRRISGAVMADLATTLSDLELKISEASVLIVIGDDPGRNQSSIGRRLGIQRANMAPLIAKLVDRGLVERTQADGRSTGLGLTARGAALTHVVRDRITAHESRMFNALTPEERRGLQDLLVKLWEG